MRISDWSSDVCSSDLFTRQAVVLPVAHGTEQNGRRTLGQIQRAGRQRVSLLGISGAAHRRRLQVEIQAQSAQYAHGLLGDFGTNSVAGQYSNLVSHKFS